MRVEIHKQFEDYKVAINRYKNSSEPLLVLTYHKNKIIGYYTAKTDCHSWSNYLVIKLKLYLNKIGLRPYISDGRLYLYRELIVNATSLTNKYTEGSIIVTMLSDFGITTKELIDVIVEASKEYLEGRS